MMKETVSAVVMGALLMSAFPASAEPRHWHEHEIHRFADHDMRVWRDGRWYHGRHSGRYGWWWIAAGAWYFYPAPVYPYPDPYVPPTVVVPAPQPPVVVAPRPVAPAPQTVQYWYYCEPARGYYPYVPSCPEPWKPVAAQPAP